LEGIVRFQVHDVVRLGQKVKIGLREGRSFKPTGDVKTCNIVKKRRDNHRVSIPWKEGIEVDFVTKPVFDLATVKCPVLSHGQNLSGLISEFLTKVRNVLKEDCLPIHLVRSEIKNGAELRLG
jgi:hypothetical protein